MLYKVKSNLKHNGITYTKGKKVELDKKTAKPLLDDNIIVEITENIDDEDREAPQPAVNKVSREGDKIDGEAKVEPGTIEKPQPGDNVDNEEKSGEEAGEKKTGILDKMLGKKDEDNL